MDVSEPFQTGASPFGEWLASVGLGHLEPLLRAHDIAEDVIASLTEHDLTQIGLSMGDRKRLLRAVARLTGLHEGPRDPALASPIAHTELRQLTIMFCDLVDATALSARLSPESWREVVLAYQRAAVAVITHRGGSVAQYLGDGLLVYFGYPQAQEDAAVQAVHAGLQLIEALSGLDVAPVGQDAVRLQARIGLHTGMVVIGDIGAGPRREQLALGEVPHIAARLQELAVPNTVLITDETRRLTAGSFHYDDLGAHALKGVHEPRQVWRALEASGVPSRFDARSGGGLSPLVGRAQEMALLLDRWQAALQGQGQVVLISGEAGMGKSRLLKELRDRLGDAGRHAVSFQCVAHRADDAFHPVAEALARMLRLRPDMSAAERRGRIDALVRERHGLSAHRAAHHAGGMAAAMEAMLGIAPDGPRGLSPGTPHQREQECIDMVADVLTARAARRPLLLLFEDAHWADPASLAALVRIVAQARHLPLLLLVTHRPEFVPTFDRQAHVTALKMPGLRRSEVAALVSRLMGGRTLPASMAQQIQHRTDGVPLFVEELTRALLEQPMPHDLDLAGFLPATLRDSLMARLERHPGAKALAQIGAAIGREFSHELLRAVFDAGGEGEASLGRGEPAELGQGIAALTAAGLILRYEPDGGEQAVYVFKHALVQDAAYDTLPSARKAALHARIFDALQRCHPGIAQSQPAVLARHAVAAGRFEVALALWQRAGDLALDRLALHEAGAHLQAALLALARLPASNQRDQTELGLHAALGTVHMLGKGWAAPEAEEAWRRAIRLVAVARNGEEAARPMWGLCMHHLMRGGLTQAQSIGQRMQVLAEQSQSRQARVMADTMHTQLHAHAGQLARADEACGQVLQRHDAEQDTGLTAMCSIDPMLIALVQRLHVRWLMGQVDDVEAAHGEIEARARALGHPASLAWVSIQGALIYLHAGLTEPLLKSLHEGQQIAQLHGFAHLSAMAHFAMGWCQARIDDPEEGVAMMEKALVAYKTTGTSLMLPCFMALLAESQGHAGRHADAMATLDRAWQRTEQGGERWHEAELHRIRGALLMSAPERDLLQARRRLRQALSVATAQGAQRWMRRAAQGLAALSGEAGDLAS